MINFLKNHPFAVEAHFDSSIVLTFALPKEKLQKFIPECLSLDTLNETYAFLAIAMVQTRGLRPKGFPSFMGNDFFLIGYRIFVRYKNNAGKSLRGLYILKTETDKKKMEILGNIFTHYNYTTTDILQNNYNEITEINSNNSNFHLTFKNEINEVKLPNNSPFLNWHQARRFAGPMPFTFSFDAIKNSVLIIEGVRENWTPLPLEVINYNFEFLKTLQINDAILANAFIIKNIPYHWKKGKVESWKN